MIRDIQVHKLRLPPLRNRGWIRYCLVLGITAAAIGIVGAEIVDWQIFDLLVPTGMLLALAPTFYILSFVVLAVLIYVVTLPIRLWCRVSLGLIERSGNPSSSREVRLVSVVDSLNRASEWCFGRW